MKSLNRQKKQFEWKTDLGEIHKDGPTMLCLVFKKIEPTNVLGISGQTIKLKDYNFNIAEMLDTMEETYELIIRHDGTHSTYTKDLLRALQPGHDPTVKSSMERLQRKFYAGDDITPEEIIQEALTLYTNLIATKVYQTKDPKESKIIALTTRIKQLESKVTSPGSSNPDNLDMTHWPGGVAKWRCKKQGPTIVVDGKTFWWCEKHVHSERHPNGLYMPHKPDKEHDEWQKK